MSPLDAYTAAQARCRFRLATDEVMMALQFGRDGGPHTKPFFVYESAPMPLCGTLKCAQGRGEPCWTGCTVTLSTAGSGGGNGLAAQADAARIGGGNQAPSEPAPLDESVGGFWGRVTDQERGEAWGNVVGWGIVAALVCVALAFGLTLA
jgi:hypothetical protein